MRNQLFVALVYSVIFLGVFALAELVRRRWPKLKELSRKIAHVLCGITTLSFPYFIRSQWVVLALVVTFGLLMIVSKKSGLLKSIHRVGRKSYGSFYYPVAIYIIFLLAKNQPAIYLISILTMTFSDAFAALIGKRYGTIKYEVEGSSKSLEGSVIFFLLTFLCVHLPLLFMTDTAHLNNVLIALAISFLLTGFEAISPTGSDNILIPFGTYFLLFKMVHLPLHLIIQNLYILLFVAVISVFFSVLKPSGIIAMILLNYAAITLGDIYWFVPLFLTELFFCLLVIFSKVKEKYPLRILFYIGNIPITLIFLENIFRLDAMIFIPYLAAIGAQIPLSYHLAKFGKDRAFYSVLAVLSVVIPSIFFYFGKLNLKAMVITMLLIFVIYMLNLFLHQLTDEEETKEFQVRFISTAVGTVCAFFIVYYYGAGYV